MSKVGERAMAKRARRAADDAERAETRESAAAATVLNHYTIGARRGPYSREQLLRLGWDVLSNMAGYSAAEQAQIASPAQRIALLEAMTVLERAAAE